MTKSVDIDLRKFLFVVFGLLFLVLLVGPRAFASRARLLVYGSGDPTNIVLDPSGNGGSYYYDSPYSVVYNPALLSNAQNEFIVEKSNEPGTAAQGAMFRDFGNLKAGFIFGRKGESVNYTSSNQIRPVEGFISAGQGSFRGGLGVSWFERHANNQPDQNMKLKIGAMIGASESISFEPFAHYMLIGKEKSNGADPKHKDFAFGTRLVFSEKVKVFTGYRKYKIKNDVNARSRDAYGFGVSHQVAVDEKTSFVYALGFWRQTNNDHNILPINMAAETQVLSWLSLRGGLEYHFHNVQNETSRGDTTTGRIGLTASHEKLNFDFVVGSNSQNSGTGTAHVETADQVDSQAFGFDGGFFSGAALRYLW